ncbi:MAG: GldG family protein [Terrimicrobiaceae bacterium]
MKKSVLSAIVILIAVLVGLVSLNLIGSAARFRIDLTQDRAFTLSEGTKKILASLDEPVDLRLYAASSEGTLPPLLKNYIRRVQDLLEEMSEASGGKLRVERLEPLPDSDAEDSARLDGLEPTPLPNGESLYLGISASRLDRKVALPFLPPDRERLLEYDIARMLVSVQGREKASVGIMSPLPVFGQPMSMMMMGGPGPRPWALVDELKRDFDVRELPMSGAPIPADIDVLLLVHPKGVDRATEYAIDQFVMRGGRLIAFLDPFCVLDSGMGPVPQPSSSTLPTLLPAWGLDFPTDRVVADLDFVGLTRDGRQPALLDLNIQGMNPDDVLTAGLDNVLLAFAGAWSGSPKEGSTVTDLLKSSPNNQLVEPMVARMSPESVIREFQASGEDRPLAVRLSGKLPSAFPEPPDDLSEGAKPDPGVHLKESKETCEIILVGDADMIQDPLSVSEVRGLVPGGRMIVPVNGNLVFVQSAVEQLAGSEDLIGVRSRASLNRPFTVVRAMESAAEQKFQSTIRELENSLRETEKRLNELQAGKQDGQKFLLSAEQQKEIENFRTKEAEVRKQLKETRRELRSEIDALVTRLKWLNIAAVPVAVVLAGLVYALWRRRSSNP